MSKKSKEEIIANMVDIMPYSIGVNTCKYVEEAMQEYSDHQLTEFKRKLKEEVRGQIGSAWLKSLIDKIEL